MRAPSQRGACRDPPENHALRGFVVSRGPVVHVYISAIGLELFNAAVASRIRGFDRHNVAFKKLLWARAAILGFSARDWGPARPVKNKRGRELIAKNNRAGSPKIP